MPAEKKSSAKSKKSVSRSSKSKTSAKNIKKVSSNKNKAVVKGLKSSPKDQLVNLAKFLSGEASLQKQEEKLAQLKKSAKEKQKRALNRQIAEGETKLKDDEILTPEELEALGLKSQKVVQKLKLYEWEAPIRVSFPFDRRAFLGIVALSLAFILYLAVLGHYGLMFAIASLLFFIYVAGTTEPVVTTHIITSQGIDTFEKLYEWNILRNFWFTRKNNQLMLIVETKLRAPANLILLLNEDQKKALFMLLQEKLLYKEIKKSNWIYSLTYGEYIPIEEI